MKVVINQSNYLPWKGYFDLINDADLFVFHDDLQYTKNDWRNRNTIKTRQGLKWLTIPVGTDEHRLINEVRLPEDRSWVNRHWRLIEENYQAAPYFERYASVLRDILFDPAWTRLSELNQFLTVTVAREFLGIRTKFIDSSQFRLRSHKQERVLDLLRAVGATHYVSGPAARNYLDAEKFREAGIDLTWKDYSGYPEYSQFHPPFIHALSILDLLFQSGPAAADLIWGWRTARESHVQA